MLKKFPPPSDPVAQLAAEVMENLSQLRAEWQAGATAHIELLAVVLRVNPAALEGRDPLSIRDHELAEIILAAVPEAVSLDAAPGTLYICKRCGVLLGKVIEIHLAGLPVKALHSVGVAWRDARTGLCINCSAKVYFGSPSG